MGTNEEMQRRLAAHAVEPEEQPEEPEAPVELDEKPSGPPEPKLKTVGDVIRHTGGADSTMVVSLLKMVGALVDDGGDLVYQLYQPLRPARPGSGSLEDGRIKLRFATQLGVYHQRRMLVLGEAPIQTVHLSWVEALTGSSRALVDRLGYIDGQAVMAIAQYIEGEAGNG